MKKHKTIVYMVAIIGLIIALFLISFVVGYIFSFYPNIPFDSVMYIWVTISWVIFYFGNRKLCRMLDTDGAISAALLFLVILNYFSFSIENNLETYQTIIRILASFAPVLKQKKGLKSFELKTCSFCGHINDPDAVFCTECGSGLMHEEIEISSGGETKHLFINFIKTIGIIALYFILWWITNHLGNVIAGLFTHAINLDTVLGSIIMLIIYITVETNAFFWLSVVISTLIPSKRSAVCILIAVIIIHCLQITQIWSHWALIVLFLVNLIADIIPVTLQAISSHNKKSPGD